MTELSFNFEKLEVYQKSITLNKKVYLLTLKWPREYLFGLTDQLRRATLSISLNIAEGSGRTAKDFSHFVSISRGSAFECIPILEIAQELKLISQSDFDLLYSEYKSISQMLTNLRKSLYTNEVTK